MKHYILGLLACFVFSTGSFGQNLSWKNLTGRWEGADGGGIEVVDSSKVYLIYGDQRKQLSSYKVDFSKSPAWFDFTVTDSSQTTSVRSLLLLVNDDLLKWQVFEDDNRPVHFSSDNGDLLYLRRKR
jgi:hypothetical protein